MASDLLLPTGATPSNLHLPEGMRAMHVDSDMYNIAGQVREISPDLHIWLLTAADDPRYAYAITESCKDGVERLVFKVKELDGRVLKRLRELFSIPLRVRYRQLERENFRFEQQERERIADELYENLGRPMWTELERCGFIDGRNVSYPKAGVATRGKKRR